MEDEYFVAVELASALQMNGATVLGPASTYKEGRQLALARQPDCVLLDINLHGERSFDFADELRERGITTIFTTGYDSDIVPARLRQLPWLLQPVDIAALLECICSTPRRSPPA